MLRAVNSRVLAIPESARVGILKKTGLLETMMITSDLDDSVETVDPSVQWKVLL